MYICYFLGNRQYIHKTHTTMKKGNYTDIQGVKEGGLIFNEKISMFQIKRKKMGKYLFTILKYVYLCVKFNSVT